MNEDPNAPKDKEKKDFLESVEEAIKNLPQTALEESDEEEKPDSDKEDKKNE